MDLERGLLDKAERVAHILLNEDEFDEEAIRTLLIVTGRKRQMTKAVTLYDSFAKRLRAEFKVEPSEELKSLLERLKSGLSV
jgi:DNA-binding SARP family transcriptional activator